MKTIPITFRVPEEEYQYLKDCARIRSIRENKDINVSDIVREAIAYLPPLVPSGSCQTWVNHYTSGTIYCYP